MKDYCKDCNGCGCIMCMSEEEVEFYTQLSDAEDKEVARIKVLISNATELSEIEEIVRDAEIAIPKR